MLLNYIRQRQKMLKEANNFYTPNGIHVFTKDEMMNDLVDIEVVVSQLEAKLPDHVRDGIEIGVLVRDRRRTRRPRRRACHAHGTAPAPKQRIDVDILTQQRRQ